MAVALEQFVKHLQDSGILAGETIKDFIPPHASPKDADELARQLVKQKKLTRYQAEEAYKGKAKSLVLGNYILMEKIGAGGMGQVFKAHHRRMDRFVAIKLLPSAMTSDSAAIARFEREVKAAARISHPNIVAALDADCANGVHFLVMELVEGSDLSALVKKQGPLTVGKALNYILQAARGLEAAHKKGVIHRDIKPANLLLDKEGTVKILDMGLARLNGEADAVDAPTQAELTSTGTVMGTVDYMAPEQALDTKSADGRADIYALGCSLYSLISGRSTYNGDTLMAKLLAHRDQPIPSLRAENSDVSEEMDSVFRKMVAKKAKDRYQTVSLLIADLENCIQYRDQTLVIPASQDTSVDADLMSFLSKASMEATKTPVVRQPTRKPPTGKSRKSLLIGGGVLGMLMLLAGIIVSMRTKDGTLIVEINQPDAMVQVLDAEGKVEVSQKGSHGTMTISVEPGKHRLKVVKDGFTTYGQEFEIEKNGKTEIAARLEPLEDKPAMVGTESAKSIPVTRSAVTGVKKMLAYQQPGFDEWVHEVAALPAEQQVDAVTKKLVELNPGFDGKWNHDIFEGGPQIQDGEVKSLHVFSDELIDISPMRALANLKWLDVRGTRLADLSPLTGLSLSGFRCECPKVTSLSALQGMPLSNLYIATSQVSNLSPLRGMTLNSLVIQGTLVSDLSPLREMQLSSLVCAVSRGVSDLSPLKGMPLTHLQIEHTNVVDLSPLQGMPLTSLTIDGDAVEDLSPLKDLPLTSLSMEQMRYIDRSVLKALPLKLLNIDFEPERDTELLRSIKTLETINDKPVAEFWREIDETK